MPAPDPEFAGRIEVKIDALDARLNETDARLKEAGDYRGEVESYRAQAVSRDELNESVRRATAGLEEIFESRFVRQERAAEALRSMIVETDQMLERVLEGLDRLAEARQKVENTAARR
jgi:uncharacterized coiled-coil protein SlyX